MGIHGFCSTAHRFIHSLTFLSVFRHPVNSFILPALFIFLRVSIQRKVGNRAAGSFQNAGLLAGNCTLLILKCDKLSKRIIGLLLCNAKNTWGEHGKRGISKGRELTREKYMEEEDERGNTTGTQILK